MNRHKIEVMEMSVCEKSSNRKIPEESREEN